MRVTSIASAIHPYRWASRGALLLIGRLGSVGVPDAYALVVRLDRFALVASPIRP
jgi:hypothetical protein